MFTGIIESTGKIEKVTKSQTNLQVWIDAPFVEELQIDQSVAHNGICLTVDAIENDLYRVTAIDETIQKTSIQDWKLGDLVNLERCTPLGHRLDGHIVQGHVDGLGICIQKEDQDGSWVFTFEHDQQVGTTVEKGSISINGISLTVVNSTHNQFSVAIIPYTYEFTNLHAVNVGDRVNLEFDIIGKYIEKLLTKQQ